MTGRHALHVGLIQLTSAVGELEANLAKSEALIRRVADEADVVCLPELFNVGYDLDSLGDRFDEFAERVPHGPTCNSLVALADSLEVAVIAGLVEKYDGNLFDSVVLIEPQKGVVGTYRKTHLYPAEEQFFEAGDALPVFELQGTQLGVAVCFEAAFPPIFSTLVGKGASVIFNPSAVPVGFGYLQDLRTRARAQDNQTYVVAVNRVGSEGNVKYCGRSQVANPRGEVIALCTSDEEQAVVVELDFSLISREREQEPVFQGFRPELYSFSF